MHPQIRLGAPGKCPICFMDLVSLEEKSSELGDNEIKISETARRLARVRTVPVEEGHVKKTLHFSGRVEVDKSRENEITARFAGRIERL